jgi:beta-lactam-binding protein with PASTA domain
MIAFGILVLLAAGALAWTFLDEDDPPAAGRDRPRQNEAAAEPQGTPTPEETPPASFTIGDSVLGSNVNDTEQVLKEAGFKVERIDVDSEEEKDTIVDVDPPVGTTVTPGVDTITLYVSKGNADEGNGEGPPEEPPGQEDKDKDDD